MLIACAMGIVVFATSTVFDSDGPERCKALELEVERMRTENLAIERQNGALERRISALRSDPRIIEQIAREEFGMIREGEVVYRFRR